MPRRSHPSGTSKLWAGRIHAATAPALERLNRSFPLDLRLLSADIAVNRAWSLELARLGILSGREQGQIARALDRIDRQARAGELEVLETDEDVHAAIERHLVEDAGEAGARIHTGRSRNDQVATDMLIVLCEGLRAIAGWVRRLQRAVLDRARAARALPFAAWTHLQPAQVVAFGHLLLAHFFALERDAGRLDDALRRADRCPLGSGALAGSAFPVDRARLARDLGFGAVTENSLDAVGDRDALQEAGMALAILIGHLSRLAGDLVVLTTPALGLVELDDAYSTGSSMMPQKKNPDGCELVRAKAARAAGHAAALLSVCHGLPSSYHKDLQETKEPLFALIDDASACLEVMEGTIRTMHLHERRFHELAGDDLLVATDLADELARRGLPFRKAHEAVGKLVREALALHRPLSRLPEESYRRASSLFGAWVGPMFSAEASMARREVRGGTGPQAVALALEIAERSLARAEAAGAASDRGEDR